jgi:hypothetical protein
MELLEPEAALRRQTLYLFRSACHPCRASCAPKPTFVKSSGDEIEYQNFNDGRKARGFGGARHRLSRNCHAMSGKER